MRDGSGLRIYKYLVEDIDRYGNVTVYFRRRPGPKVPMREKPGTSAFNTEYRRLFKAVRMPMLGVEQPQPGTIAWLFEKYYDSSWFLKLDPDTRKVRRRILNRICKRIGNAQYAGLEPRDIARLRDEKRETPESANSIVKTLRQIFKWACDPEYKFARKNPARDVKYLKSNNPEGHIPWEESDARKFEARHPLGTKARLLFDLMMYLGVRISDAVSLGLHMEQDGKLVFTEFKGRNHTPKQHKLPILPPLRASIDAYYETNARYPVFIVTQGGKPHETAKALGNYFARQCRLADIREGLSAHGIRKLAAIRCAEAGATVNELMALFGWATERQAVHYTRRANRRKLEETAITKLDRTPYVPS
jgi:integrase